MPENLDDLRREARIDASAEVIVKFQSQDGADKEQLHICTSEDISEGGVKLVTRRVLPVGVELPLTISASGIKQSLDIVGEVKWCLEIDELPTFYAGIKVLRIENAETQSWQDFVAELAKSMADSEEFMDER